MATEPYDQAQTRMIRDARRIQERADAEHAGQRLHARANGWADGYEMGKQEQAERDLSRKWNDRIFCLVLGTFVGFVIAAMLTAAFWTGR